eukprot:jgi/Chlat1/1937/Chrsp153S02254
MSRRSCSRLALGRRFGAAAVATKQRFTKMRSASHSPLPAWMQLSLALALTLALVTTCTSALSVDDPVM